MSCPQPISQLLKSELPLSRVTDDPDQPDSQREDNVLGDKWGMGTIGEEQLVLEIWFGIQISLYVALVIDSDGDI